MWPHLEGHIYMYNCTTSKISWSYIGSMNNVRYYRRRKHSKFKKVQYPEIVSTIRDFMQHLSTNFASWTERNFKDKVMQVLPRRHILFQIFARQPGQAVQTWKLTPEEVGTVPSHSSPQNLLTWKSLQRSQSSRLDTYTGNLIWSSRRESQLL